MKRAALVSVVLLFCSVTVRADGAAAPRLRRAVMLHARASHAAAATRDGLVVITGGERDGVVLGSTELFDPATMRSVDGPPLHVARADHSMTLLRDGRVLIAGGRSANGATDSTEIFDPTGGLQVGPRMNAARAGHTATLLRDGRVLFAGGDDTGSLEIYDPSTNAFEMVNASFAVARRDHSAIELKNGEVLFVGGAGRNGKTVKDGEVFDPATGAFRFTGEMRTLGERIRPALNLLPDGKVQVIGGDEPGTMEMFNNERYYFIAQTPLNRPEYIDSLLQTPSRRGLHRSERREVAPSFRDITDPSRVDSHRGVDADVREFLATDDFADTRSGRVTVRTGGTKSGIAANSVAIVPESTAMVTTDKTDYAPGERVTISGTGWTPGDKVTITLHEEPTTDADRLIEVYVDSEGNFTDRSFAPDGGDLGVTFFVLAASTPSLQTAQTTFTDAEGTTTLLTTSPNPSVQGNAVALSATVRTYSGSAVNDGYVYFYVNNVAIGYAYSNGNGVYAITTTSIPVGTATVQASFYPNQHWGSYCYWCESCDWWSCEWYCCGTYYYYYYNYNGSTSNSVYQTVTPNCSAPSITAPSGVNASTGPEDSACSTYVSDAAIGTPTVTKGCGTVTTSRTGVPAGNNFPVGTTVITWKATDSNGNIATATQSISVADQTAPVIVLNGGDATVECHTPYADLGATVSDNCAGAGPAQVTGVVDWNTPGTYDLTYAATDAAGNAAAPAVRHVTVVDTTAPAVTLNGDAETFVECHTQYLEPGATATDSCAGDLTGAIHVAGSVDVNTPGSYTITYSVADPAGNAAANTRTVTVRDTTAPSISLNGAAIVHVECHTAFADDGATATDSCAGDLSRSISVNGSVDSNTPGTYSLTYSVADPSGNPARPVTRTVIVEDTIPPTLQLSGAATMTVECHGAFADPGATATDSCAGDVTSGIHVSGAVDVNTPGTYTLTYTVADISGNPANPVTRTVVVADTQAPEIHVIGGDATVECHGTYSDQGATATDSCAGDVSGRIQTESNVDVSTPGFYTVTYRVTDPAGNTSASTRHVTVADTTAPSLELVGALTLTVECHTPFTDPGATSVDACSGEIAPSVSGIVDVNAPGTYVLTYSAVDASGNRASSVTRTVIVADTVAPVLELVGGATLEVECHTSFVDPGATAHDSCAGDLTPAIGVSGNVDPNTPGTYILRYNVSDPSHNAATEVMRTVVVRDTTPPSISCPAPRSIAACSAPVPDFTSSTAASDSCSSQLTITQNPAPGTVLGIGSHLITLTATDGSGNVSTCTTTFSVVNNAPIVAAGGPYTAGEGSTVSLTATGSDPDGNPIAYSWDFDGNGTIDATGQSVSFSAIDGPAPFSVTVIATDACGLSSTATTAMTVTNVAPAITALSAPIDPTAVNSSITAAASFTDPGVLDTHTAAWNWGDGTTSTPGVVIESNGSGSVTGSHVYTAAGIYTVSLTVTDKDGGTATNVFRYVVVYDPSAGFVTGGGWINSPAGAYAADPALSGKATFGFVAKYQKGQSTPSGNTQFEFRAGSLDFHSTAYDWLVVSGAKAQYKGIGTINGAGDYGFILSAIDGQLTGGGGTDKFRIKIWDRPTGSVVYDNMMNSDDTSDPTTVISGGSIVIHK